MSAPAAPLQLPAPSTYFIASRFIVTAHFPVSQYETAMPAQTYLFGCLQDNFGVLLHDPQSGATAAIDAPEAAPIEAALKKTGWRLTDILVTHHHADHTEGIDRKSTRLN